MEPKIILLSCWGNLVETAVFLTITAQVEVSLIFRQCPLHRVCQMVCWRKPLVLLSVKLICLRLIIVLAFDQSCIPRKQSCFTGSVETFVLSQQAKRWRFVSDLPLPHWEHALMWNWMRRWPMRLNIIEIGFFSFNMVVEPSALQSSVL